MSVWKAIAIAVIFLSNVVIHEAAGHLYVYCSIASVFLATGFILNYMYINTIVKAHEVYIDRKKESALGRKKEEETKRLAKHQDLNSLSDSKKTISISANSHQSTLRSSKTTERVHNTNLQHEQYNSFEHKSPPESLPKQIVPKHQETSSKHDAPNKLKSQNSLGKELKPQDIYPLCDQQRSYYQECESNKRNKQNKKEEHDSIHLSASSCSNKKLDKTGSAAENSKLSQLDLLTLAALFPILTEPLHHRQPNKLRNNGSKNGEDKVLKAINELSDVEKNLIIQYLLKNDNGADQKKLNPKSKRSVSSLNDNKAGNQTFSQGKGFKPYQQILKTTSPHVSCNPTPSSSIGNTYYPHDAYSESYEHSYCSPSHDNTARIMTPELTEISTSNIQSKRRCLSPKKGLRSSLKRSTHPLTPPISPPRSLQRSSPKSPTITPPPSVVLDYPKFNKNSKVKKTQFMNVRDDYKKRAVPVPKISFSNTSYNSNISEESMSYDYCPTSYDPYSEQQQSVKCSESFVNEDQDVIDRLEHFKRLIANPQHQSITPYHQDQGMNQTQPGSVIDTGGSPITINVCSPQTKGFLSNPFMPQSGYNIRTSNQNGNRKRR